MADRVTGDRRTLQDGALKETGEKGYRALTVQGILNRAEVDRPTFYRYYPDKGTCFTSAYAVEMEFLVSLLDKSCEDDGWCEGLHRALTLLFEYLEAHPLKAKGLLQAQAVGGEALSMRQEAHERFKRAIDQARRASAWERDPPPLTSEFILYVIEAAVTESFFGPTLRSASSIIRDLEYIAISAYFGRSMAESWLDR